MSKNKSKKDTISEQTYNREMATASTLPEDDSPGDSEVDAGSEFLMGMNYMPNENNEFEDSGDEPGEIVFSEPAQSVKETLPKKIIKIPETAKIVSSEQPEPWLDRDTPSDTH